MKNSPIKVLDCTLRDGGYYNNWDFHESTVNKYLSAVKDAKVDIVELGFRSLQRKKFLGKFGYTEDIFLNSLELPSEISYAVMINAGDLINYENGIDKAINLLFSDQKSSPVEIVRIASHPNEVNYCKEIAFNLKNLGYRVFLNLMQITSIDNKSLRQIVNDINKWNCVETLYFADSFGNMDTNQIESVTKNILSEWDGDIGIHAHDNKNQALANSMKSIEHGVTYLDATILGMGRGAGNTKMETLLVEIKNLNLGDYNPECIFHLALNEFSVLKDQYNWGPNIYYFLSATHGIHPTYIQEMLSDNRYLEEQIFSAINFLKTAESSLYSFKSMKKAISKSSEDIYGKWSAKNWARDKDILIIGSGPSIQNYKEEIIEFIKRQHPIVLCLNINKSFPEELVSAYVACHESRILIESDLYFGLDKPIILPLSSLPDEFNKLFVNINIFDYGLKIKEASFEIFDNGCVLDSALAFNYAISIATASGAKQILLAGFDGYEKSDPKQLEMLASLEKYNKQKKSKPVFALTPTSYPIDSKSIYMSKRFHEMSYLLSTSKYFKLVCGAGNEDTEEVKRLSLLYTLAGAKGLDISANVEVVKACKKGVDMAFEIAKEFEINLKIRPFIMVSVGMPGDHHVRKSFINLDTCIKCNLCIPVCPTDAIPKSLVVIKDKCIGCGNCSAVCPKPDIIHYEHNQRSLRQLLPDCLEAGAEQIELHAAVADDDLIMDEWKMVSQVCPDGHISMCLDRLHLSNFAFEKRIIKAKEIAKERLIIQSDGYPMSGGEDDYNTTLQAVATADILNKKFNMTLRKSNNTLIYKKVNSVNQLISGGTNSLTAELAKKSGVKFQGASLGTYARKIVKEVVDDKNFYSDKELIKKGYLIAKKLVVANVGEINE